MSDQLERLEVILRERERLRGLLSYCEGASERSPHWDDDDEAAWRELMGQMREADGQLREVARSLRRHHGDAFAQWVAERRSLHEQRLASPEISEWERDHLAGTIRRWRRYLSRDFDAFYAWTSW